jgi:hypothetical protein
MMGRSSLAQTIRSLVSEAGRRARLSELQSNGVHSVRLVGADQLAALIEQSLDRVLEERVLELTDSERAEMLGRAREEFERLRTRVQGLEGESERKRLELTQAELRISQLHREFDTANRTLDAELLAARDARAPHEVDGSAEQAALLAIVRKAGVPPGLAERVASAIEEFLVQERAQAVEAAASATRERVSLLERRISKLNESLERTERELAGALESHAAEEGVSSIYRTVQGLRASARSFEKKKTMLNEIFAKNLELQKGDAPR